MENTYQKVETNDDSKLEEFGISNDLKVILDELVYAGLVECEMRWDERSRQWEPMYSITELGRAVSVGGLNLEEYLPPWSVA
jgi:hypothetical protein